MSPIESETADGIRKGKSAAESMVDEAQRKAADVASKVREAGGQAADYVRDQYGHLSDQARDAYSRARETAHEWEQSAEGYVQRSPLKAILIAAGVGVLVGLLVKRS